MWWTSTASDGTRFTKLLRVTILDSCHWNGIPEGYERITAREVWDERDKVPVNFESIKSEGCGAWCPRPEELVSLEEGIIKHL